MAGMLAYVTIIPSIVVLVLEPYNKNRFIRFHSSQNIFFYIAWIVIGVALRIFAEIPVLGWLSLLIWPLIGLGGLVLWIILLLKAYQGQMFKLPIIGDLAEQQVSIWFEERLQNAGSIASLMLTTEALVAEIQEETKGAPASGGRGSMGDMY
jgi:uncharacterized membrane protein